MKQRISIKDLEPDAYQAIAQLNKQMTLTTLDKSLKELIKIRASQINGCSYCIEMHTAEALRQGESQRRIFALSAWWESPLFTAKEKALLTVTEEVTLIAEQGLSEESYQKAKEFFSENEIAQIIMQIGTINLLNRIAVSTHMFHENQ